MASASREPEREILSRRRADPPPCVVPFNDLARVSGEQREMLGAAVSDVIGSGWYVHGPQQRAFEVELAGYLGVAHVLGVGNGTDALEIALRATATKDRRTVVTAANAGGYTSIAARAAGMRVRYADVDPTTHCIDAGSVAAALDDSVAAVVVTHLYGRVVDVSHLRALCRDRGVRMVEDCAQSIGARVPEGAGGGLGDLATFSFYPTKNLGAIGDGGAVATRDPELADAVRGLRQYGWSEKYAVASTGGRNSRLDELQAAVLRLRLPLVDAWNRRRREVVSAYAAVGNPRVHVLPAVDESHAAHLAVVETDDAADLASHLAARGVQSSVHFPVPDHRQPAWAPDHPGLELPVTDGLVGRVLSLPCFPELTPAETEQVCDAVSSY